MPIVPAGSTNLAAIGVPNVYVQITPPNPLINGVPTDIIGIVGTAIWGQKNSPVIVGSLQEGLQHFGNPQVAQYDLMTQVYNALQQGANDFRCVRVTDGTDVAASCNLLDGSDATGAILSSIYTGTLPNPVTNGDGGIGFNAVLGVGSGSTDSAPTYKLSLYFNGGVPEVFDNIGGTGATFWSNLVNAVNLGQSNLRGPSQLCTAATTTGISGVSISAPGSYATMPTFSVISANGSGATFVPHMESVSATVVAAGTGYVQADTITITGGSAISASVFTVATTQLISAAVNAAGTFYAPGDTITLSGGTSTTKAILNVTHTKLISATLGNGGSGYLVNDTITLLGGTAGTKAIMTVDSVDGGGAVLTFHVTTAGDYTVNATSFTQFSTSGSGIGATFTAPVYGVLTTTINTGGIYSVNTASFTQFATSGSGTGATFNTAVWGVNTVTVTTPGDYIALPSSPVSQGATSGIGSGATFTVLWGVLSVSVSASGSGYTTSDTLSITGGGGTGGAIGSITLGSIDDPVVQSKTMSGGLNGNSGVVDSTLIGVDGANSRTGMYALRKSGVSIGLLSDQTNPTYWPNQVTFGEEEGIYMIGAITAGYQDNISGAVDIIQEAGINSYAMKMMMGDWIYIADPFNQVTRLTSPQAFVAGKLAVLQPSGSSLNKIMNSIVATQKSSERRVYSDADLLALEVAGIDVITNGLPIAPYSGSFGVRIGINTSSNPVTNGDNYTRMINFLAQTFISGLGLFVGLPQTPDVQRQARNTLQSFLQSLVNLNMIGTVDGSPAFRVTLDSTNNPPNRVALGFMQADIQVTLFSIIQRFVINLQAGQSVQIQVLPVQLAA